MVFLCCFLLSYEPLHLRPEITSTSRQSCIGPPSGSSQSSKIEKKNKSKQKLCRILSQDRHLKIIGLYIYIYNIYIYVYSAYIYIYVIYIYTCIYVYIYYIYIYIYISQFNKKFASEENTQKTSFEGWRLAVLGRVLLSYRMMLGSQNVCQDLQVTMSKWQTSELMCQYLHFFQNFAPSSVLILVICRLDFSREEFLRVPRVQRSLEFQSFKHWKERTEKHPQQFKLKLTIKQALLFWAFSIWFSLASCTPMTPKWTLSFLPFSAQGILSVINTKFVVAAEIS